VRQVPDAIIVDLEDAVASADKERARQALVAALDQERPVVIRINGHGTEWFEDDLQACNHAGIAAIMLPKTEAPDDLRALHTRFGLPLLALIETARGSGMHSRLHERQACNVSPSVRWISGSTWVCRMRAMLN
jgi:citrate lyase beta subunit